MKDIGIDINPLLTANPLDQAAQAAKSNKQIEHAAKDFETFLVQQLLEQMRRTIDESSLTEESTSKQMRGLFWHYLGQYVGQSGSLGLGKQLTENLNLYQNEAKQPQKPSLEQEL